MDKSSENGTDVVRKAEEGDEEGGRRGGGG